MNNLPIRDASYLPYGLFLTYLVEIFRVSGGLSDEQSKAVLSWFWYTSATLYFGGASTGQISRDLNVVREFASGSRVSLYVQVEIDISRLLFDKFNLKNASSTTFALLLLSVSGGTAISGRPIPLDLIGAKDSRIFGRISPDNIADKNISVVIDVQRNGSSEIGVELEKQLLSNDCVFDAERQDEISFVINRANLVSSFIESVCGCQSHYSIEALMSLQLADNGDSADID